MAIRWSPGCKCCGGDPCNRVDVRFTPTSKSTRGNYAEWLPSHVYQAGERFAHYRISDGRICHWQTPGPMQSASAWTAFEETRYQLLGVLDYVDDVEEWDLFGSGWDSLTPEQKSDYIINGRLAAGMGYVSKGEPIADVKNFSVIFRTVAANLSLGVKHQAIVAASLDESGEPDSYFALTLENFGINNDPEGQGAIGNNPLRTSLDRIESKATTETYDTAWGAGSGVVGINLGVCRKAEIVDGVYNSVLSLGPGGVLDITTVAAAGIQNVSTNGYSWKLTDGPGTIQFTDGSLPVQGGEIITQINETDPHKLDSWLIRDPADVPTYDLLSTTGIFAQRPDETGVITGKRIGFYVATGSTPGTAYDIELFAGAAVSNSGSLAYDICPLCREGSTCPCEDGTEYPVFATLQKGVDFSEWPTFAPLVPPGESNAANLVYGPIEDVGMVVSETYRNSLCIFVFARQYAYSQQMTTTRRPTYRARYITYLTEHIEFRVSLFPQMKVELWGRSAVYVNTLLYAQNDTGTDIPVPTPAQAKTPLGYSPPGPVFPENGTLGLLASGSLRVWPIDLADFSCKAFMAQGTYTDGVTFPGRPTNSWIGDEWVIASG